MDPKENYLRAIAYEGPAYVPYPDEGFQVSVALDGNFRRGDWTDASILIFLPRARRNRCGGKR